MKSNNKINIDQKTIQFITRIRPPTQEEIEQNINRDAFLCISKSPVTTKSSFNKSLSSEFNSVANSTQIISQLNRKKLKDFYMYSCFKNRSLPIIYLKKNAISGNLLNSNNLSLKRNKITEISKKFQFSQVYDETQKISQLHKNSSRKLVAMMFSGFNTSILCFGAKESGKTYTLRGSEQQKDNGLVIRCVSDVLKFIEKTVDKKEFIIHNKNNQQQDNCQQIIYQLFVSIVQINIDESYDLIDNKKIQGCCQSQAQQISSLIDLQKILNKASVNQRNYWDNNKDEMRQSTYFLQLILKKQDTNSLSVRNEVATLNFIELPDFYLKLLNTNKSKINQANNQLLQQQIQSARDMLQGFFIQIANNFLEGRQIDCPQNISCQDYLAQIQQIMENSQSIIFIAHLSPTLSDYKKNLSTLRYSNELYKIIKTRGIYAKRCPIIKSALEIYENDEEDEEEEKEYDYNQDKVNQIKENSQVLNKQYYSNQQSPDNFQNDQQEVENQQFQQSENNNFDQQQQLTTTEQICQKLDFSQSQQQQQQSQSQNINTKLTYLKECVEKQKQQLINVPKEQDLKNIWLKMHADDIDNLLQCLSEFSQQEIGEEKFQILEELGQMRNYIYNLHVNAKNPEYKEDQDQQQQTTNNQAVPNQSQFKRNHSYPQANIRKSSYYNYKDQNIITTLETPRFEEKIETFFENHKKKISSINAATSNYYSYQQPLSSSLTRNNSNTTRSVKIATPKSQEKSNKSSIYIQSLPHITKSSEIHQLNLPSSMHLSTQKSNNHSKNISFQSHLSEKKNRNAKKKLQSSGKQKFNDNNKRNKSIQKNKDTKQNSFFQLKNQQFILNASKDKKFKKSPYSKLYTKNTLKNSINSSISPQRFSASNKKSCKSNNSKQFQSPSRSQSKKKLMKSQQIGFASSNKKSLASNLSYRSTYSYASKCVQKKSASSAKNTERNGINSSGKLSGRQNQRKSSKKSSAKKSNSVHSAGRCSVCSFTENALSDQQQSGNKSKRRSSLKNKNQDIPVNQTRKFTINDLVNPLRPILHSRKPSTQSMLLTKNRFSNPISFQKYFSNQISKKNSKQLVRQGRQLLKSSSSSSSSLSDYLDDFTKLNLKKNGSQQGTQFIDSTSNKQIGNYNENNKYQLELNLDSEQDFFIQNKITNMRKEELENEYKQLFIKSRKMKEILKQFQDNNESMKQQLINKDQQILVLKQKFKEKKTSSKSAHKVIFDREKSIENLQSSEKGLLLENQQLQLALNEYRDSTQQIERDFRAFQDQKNSQEENLKETIKELSDKVQGYQNEFIQNQTQFEKYKYIEKTLNNELQNLNKKYTKDLDNKQRELDKLVNQLNTKSVEVETRLQTELSLKQKLVKELQTTVQQLNKEKQEIQTKLESQIRKIMVCEQQIQKIQEDEKQKNLKIENNEELIQQLKNDSRVLQMQLENQIKQNQDLKQQMNELKTKNQQMKHIQIKEELEPPNMFNQDTETQQIDNNIYSRIEQTANKQSIINDQLLTSNQKSEIDFNNQDYRYGSQLDEQCNYTNLQSSQFNAIKGNTHNQQSRILNESNLNYPFSGGSNATQKKSSSNLNKQALQSRQGSNLNNVLYSERTNKEYYENTNPQNQLDMCQKHLFQNNSLKCVDIQSNLNLPLENQQGRYYQDEQEEQQNLRTLIPGQQILDNKNQIKRQIIECMSERNKDKYLLAKQNKTNNIQLQPSLSQQQIKEQIAQKENKQPSYRSVISSDRMLSNSTRNETYRNPKDIQNIIQEQLKSKIKLN